MSGIDCTLIAHLGTQLFQQTGERFSQQLFLTKNTRDRMFFGKKDHTTYWPRHEEWQDNARLEYNEAYSALEEKADQQPMPADDPRKEPGLTLKSVVYYTLYAGAMFQGHDEALGRARVLMACQDFDLSDDLMQQLCRLPTLDLLLRRLITDAAAVRKQDPTQDFLRRTALHQQFTNTQGYLPQQLLCHDQPLLSLSMSFSSGNTPHFQCRGDWDALFSRHPHLMLAQPGGMGKSTFLKALKTSIKEQKAGPHAPAQVLYLPLRSISQVHLSAMMHCSDVERALWQDHLLWYCLCLGQPAQYQSIRQCLKRGQRVLVLLDGYQEITDTPAIKSAIDHGLRNMLNTPGLSILLTGRLVPEDHGVPWPLEPVTLSGVPQDQIDALLASHAIQATPSIQQLCSIPLYFGLLSVHLSSLLGKEWPLHRYNLLQLAFDEALRREIGQIEADDIAPRLHVWLEILPRLALWMATERPEPSESQLLRKLDAIHQELQQSTSLQQLCHGFFTKEPYVPLPNTLSPSQQLDILLASGWLMRDGHSYRFSRHQDFRDQLAARLVHARIQALLHNYQDEELPGLLKLQLNLPRPIASLLKEALFQLSPWDGLEMPPEKQQLLIRQGMERHFGHLPAVEKSWHLEEGCIACGALIRDLSEYLPLHAKDFGMQLLMPLERITRCLQQPHRLFSTLSGQGQNDLEATLQKTAEIYRRTGQYEAGIALLSCCPENRIGLRHQLAKLLLESAVKGNGSPKHLHQGLRMLEDCAQAGYYLSCSLYGMLLSAPHPLLLTYGIMETDYVRAAEIYYQGCHQPGRSGTDIVYLVRNLLMLLYRGVVEIAGPFSPGLPPAFRRGDGHLLKENPPLAEMLLASVLPFHGKRCSLPLGCHLWLEGKREQAAQAFRQDNSLLSRILLTAFTPELQQSGMEDILMQMKNELHAAEDIHQSIESYHPLYRYLDSREALLSTGLAQSADFEAMEAGISSSLQPVFALALQQRQAALQQES